MFRIAFDPSLPLVAASSFNGTGRAYAAGDPFDWRALGMSELEVMDMYKANLLTHVPQAQPETPPQPSKRKR